MNSRKRQKSIKSTSRAPDVVSVAASSRSTAATSDNYARLVSKLKDRIPALNECVVHVFNNRVVHMYTYEQIRVLLNDLLLYTNNILDVM